ncbi:DUF1826 domain-containing protein [Zavarzinia compransoris]|uniref:DUF1826 domain-containing protein n=1 Tax=Zavarzinia marina TaxID=2911065 RepID=UPI001F1BA0E7|nr:DUF1826 domain-containing protein [Zavarzinia marina]MCF4164902.1 DUF1826 domain-containing protein [Zavarzinia marina]
MNHLAPSLPPPETSRVIIGRDADVLGRLQTREVALAIWPRRLPAPLADWLDALAAGLFPDFRIQVDVADLPAALEAMIAASPLPAGPERQMLVDDVFTLAWRFAATLDLAAVDVRLEPIGGDACWKFHRDHVPARLVTTYAGPGTEWVPPSFASRAIEDQKDYAGPLERLSAGDVALFRGCAGHHGHGHGDDHAHGIVHRSPPVAGTGVTRLLLCLNPPSLASPPAWRKG